MGASVEGVWAWPFAVGVLGSASGLDLLDHQEGIRRAPAFLGTLSVLLSINSKRAAASFRLFVAMGAPRRVEGGRDKRHPACACRAMGTLYLSSAALTTKQQDLRGKRGGEMGWIRGGGSRWRENGLRRKARCQGMLWLGARGERQGMARRGCVGALGQPCMAARGAV